MASAGRLALEVFFRSTGGDGWSDKSNWATDAELSTWEGVDVDEDGFVVGLFSLDNNLQGSIPDELGSLGNLTDLELGSNKLTGPIPEALGSLTNLRKLDLGDNNLTGPIPVAIGSLANLMELDIDNNKLTGPIPEVIGSLTNLRELNLCINELTGPIPEFLESLTNLTVLDLAKNKLTGPILDALGALANLRTLSLSNNQLTGPIPEALGALTSLKELVLGGNQLTGTVPVSVWKLPHTTKVSLTSNLLTHLTDPEHRTAGRMVLDCMERLEREGAKDSFSGLLTSGNPWEFPPAAVLANGQESIQKYYHTWEECNFSLVEIHSLKVVFVGAAGAGKTSLARSIKMGRGDRTPEEDEDLRTTVGVDLHSHTLTNGTECKIYDVAGQITYYGLHQFFLTERAVYVVVWDATKFQGLSGKDLDEAIEDNILEWVSLLHMRTPLCTVMLVASHHDELDGAPEENEKLLTTVEQRFVELHTKWKALRHRQNSSIDARMTVLPGVFPVGCKLAAESASCVATDGLQAIEGALSMQTVVVSRVPPSWVAARDVLEQVGGAHDDRSGEATAVDGRRRPWELRSVIHDKFISFIEEERAIMLGGEGREHPASWLAFVREDGIRHSMDGAIELRAFSGTVISHDVFVVLDVMWLAGVLKPILDHRGITKNDMGDQVFANRELNTSNLLTWASELVDWGILRKGFSRFLWRLGEEATEGVGDSYKMEPTMFEEILDGIGVTIPLPETSSSTPVDDKVESSTPAVAETESQGDGGDGCRQDGVDLLVIMRLPPEADAETRDKLALARQVALTSGDTSGGGNKKLKAVFEFDHAGAPHGLPERMMALSHKIGILSSRARWRLGGHFLLGNSRSSSMIFEYDKKSKTMCIETLGRTTVEVEAVQFVISALFHVARDFPGASWTGWLECGMSHRGEKMYYLATPSDKQNQSPGSEIVPLTRSSRFDRGNKQRNLCSMQGYDERGPCTLDPDLFGKVLDVRQPFAFSDEAVSRGGGSEGRNANQDPSTRERLAQLAGDMTKLTKAVDQVQEGVGRVEGGVGRVEAGLQKVDEDIQAIARGMQKSLVLLKNLQGQDYPYPHLVAVKEVQAEGTRRSLWSRLRGMFVMDMTMHFLCPIDRETVPCGYGGNGYRLRTTRGWLKKISPALQVTIVTAKVALRAVAGVDVTGLLEGFLQEFKTGLVEELVDRSLDEDALLSVVSGDEDAGADMQRKTRGSYAAITEFMKKEEAKRNKMARDGDGYVDFRSRMKQVHDENRELVWVRTENVQKWKNALPSTAPST